MSVNIIRDKIELLREKIAEAAISIGGSEEKIIIVAVSKGREVAAIQYVLSEGITHFGENYLQDALPKLEALKNRGITWHFLGHVQRNKLHKICNYFNWIHSIDRLAIANKLSKLKSEGVILPPILVEVKFRQYPTTYGVLPENIEALIEEGFIPNGVQIEGLMTMAPRMENPEDVRPIFRALRSLAEKIRAKNYPEVSMKHLSMGMTDDFTVAIQEGATMIRIGRGIFG